MNYQKDFEVKQFDAAHEVALQITKDYEDLIEKYFNEHNIDYGVEYSEYLAECFLDYEEIEVCGKLREVLINELSTIFEDLTKRAEESYRADLELEREYLDSILPA